MIKVNTNNTQIYNYTYLLGIAPTRNCTKFLKIRFLVAGGGFYSYYIKGLNQKKKGSCKKQKHFMHKKRFITFLKIWNCVFFHY